MRKLLVLIAMISNLFLYSQSCSNITATDIFGNTSVQISCGSGACIELTTTNIPTTFLTTSYKVEPQVYAPVIPFNQGTPINANTDDTFSDIIPIPFNFCFYGGTYNKLVISPNGFITFDITQAKLENNPNILDDNPSSSLPRNSIFGVMNDLIYSPGEDSEIYYTVVGSAPCRKFIINFYKARITGCTETSTSQIVLSEFSNEIDIIVENKPLPCATAKFKESLIGIMNDDGDDGLSPPARNKGIWQTGNESWKYSPTGAQVQPTFTWKNSSNQVVGTTNTINACPTKTDKYTVNVNYLVCGNNFTLSDDIDITYGQGGSAPIITDPANPPRITLCDNNADNSEVMDWATLVTPYVTTDPTLNVRYYNTRAAAELGGAGITTITKEGQYQIFTRVTNLSGCYTIGIVNLDIKFLDKIKAIDIKKLYCFDGMEDFEVNLKELYPEMLITPISEIKNVTFYTTLIDATVPNTGTEIPDSELEHYLLKQDGNVVIYTFFVRFENADGCYTVKKITIELRNPITNSNQNICDFANDGTETVSLNSLNGAVSAGQPVKVSYFPDSASANANSGAITTYLLQSSNAPNIIYVRLDMVADNGNCYRVYPVSLTLTSSPILTKELVTRDLGLICDNNNDGSEPIDLRTFQKEIYFGTDTFTYTYYESYNPATGVFSNGIPNPAAFRISKNTDVYVRVSKGACFAVAKITINFNFLPTVVIKSTFIAKCDKEFDGEKFDLNDAKPNMFIAAQNTEALADMNVYYYVSKDNAIKDIERLTNPVISVEINTEFWARFESKNYRCYSVASILLKNYHPPKAIPSAIKVCDNNLDGNPEVNLLLPEFTKNMVSETDPENNFRFYLTLADVTANKPIQNPQNFSPKPFPGRIYVLVENIAGCFTLPASIDFTLGAGLSVGGNTFTLEQCDGLNDGQETINLSQFENQITAGATYFYYPTLQDLNNDTRKITTPSAYAYDNSVNPPVVFIKVTKTGYCPALVKINIKFKKAPVFDLDKYYFCPGVGIPIEPDLSYLNPEEYTWKNPAGETISKDKSLPNVQIAGKYSLTIRSSTGCTHTDYFDVIAYEVPIIRQLIGLSATSYKVIATGSRKIVYSIDGINWQNSNVFENLTPGRITFYVRFEDSECLGDTKDGLSVKIVNVITPNEDGKNDTWSFNIMDVYGDTPSTIEIYDENGIIVHEQTDASRFFWNGKFNGRSLPTASYWYLMIFPDKTITGWILLKNRN